MSDYLVVNVQQVAVELGVVAPQGTLGHAPAGVAGEVVDGVVAELAHEQARWVYGHFGAGFVDAVRTGLLEDAVGEGIGPVDDKAPVATQNFHKALVEPQRLILLIVQVDHRVDHHVGKHIAKILIFAGREGSNRGTQGQATA